MKKVSYEAWAVVRGGQLARECNGSVITSPHLEYMKFLAGFAPVAKVRVTIEPVKAKKKRKVAR